MTKDSYVLANQLRTVDEQRFVTISGKLSKDVMKEVDKALRVSLFL